MREDRKICLCAIFCTLAANKHHEMLIMRKIELDRFDYQILDALQHDARSTHQKLAQQWRCRRRRSAAASSAWKRTA